jgi:hypothetical protein
MTFGLRFFAIHFALDVDDTFCILLLMNFEPNSHREIIDAAWPEIEAYALAIGVPANTGRGHRARNSIPSRYWPAVCEDAQKRGYPITADMLTQTQKPINQAKVLQCLAEKDEVVTAVS